MASNWEINRDILVKCYPGLLEELSSDNGDILADDEIKIETTPCGEPSLCVRGNYAHSPRDPLREGQRIAQMADSANGAVIILGFGLGYAACAAAKIAAKDSRPVIIVEKYKNLLLKALESRDLSGFLSQNDIIFVLGGSGESITNALNIANSFTAENDDEKPAPSIIRNRALTALDEEWYKSVEDRIRTWAMRDEVNMATHRRFAARWVRNLSRNMETIRDYPGISRLAGLASGDFSNTNKGVLNNITEGMKTRSDTLPVFLAAAGPSLDKITPLLREIKRRCIIVAVDTSLRFFLRNEVEPDFVLVVDPQFWNSRHLDRCNCSKTALIAESAVYPPVMKLPFKNIFLCGSLFPIGTFIENQVDPKGKLGAGGSVATTAWDFARNIGAREIWIAGLDLAYPDFKTHFRGARFEELSNAGCSRLNPAETWIARILRDGIPYKTRSGSNEKILTDRRLSLYAAWFENQFRKYKEVKNFSLFRSGIEITGLNPAQEKDFLSLADRRDEIDRRIEERFSQIETDFHETQESRSRTERYEKAVSVLTRGLKNIKNAAIEGAAITMQASADRTNPEQQKKIIKKLDALMCRITDSEVKEVASFLFPPPDNEKNVNLGGDQNDPFRTYMKTSRKFFLSLAQAAEFNLICKR
ncbi:MAG: DUF115 domain-containing protein [Treponema sp.]|nr:DUF115 domain-containing protein [Treponema sp.]